MTDSELIRTDEVNDAYRRVLAGDVRYRFVIDTATIQASNYDSLREPGCHGRR